MKATLQINNHIHSQHRLTLVVRSLAKEKAVRRKLAEIKSQAMAWVNRPDFLWHRLIASFATMGNSKAAEKIDYDALSFDNLIKGSPPRRRLLIGRTFKKAGVRFYAKKTAWLTENLDRISQMGGAVKASKALLKLPDKDAKIQFLDSFKGIGPKYARNIMMDVYDKHFRESIAIDSRIKKVSDILGVSFHGYPEHEKFYTSVAHDAGLKNTWELDRLLYNFNKEVISGLQKGRAKSA